MTQSRLYESIVNGNAKDAATLARQSLDAGYDPVELVTRHVIPAMDEVGKRYEIEEYFVPELLLSGRAMKAALEPVRPLLAARKVQPTGRVVIGTVKGDLHDIGKNLVASMLEGGGFEVHNLGANVPAERFVEEAKARSADIVALSALLTVTMPAMRTTIEALRKSVLSDRVKIIVGGAPLTEQYAREIGADGYSQHASAAVGLARQLMSTNSGGFSAF